MKEYISEIAKFIYIVRGHKVILSSDLAFLYDVPTKRLNEQVKRNVLRFPNDFAFRLSPAEWKRIQADSNYNNLKSQIATSSLHGGLRKIPWAFTEYGVIQVASVLNSDCAIKMSVAVVRAFVFLRQNSQSIKKIDEKLSYLGNRVDAHDQQIVSIVNAIRKLSSDQSTQRKKKIGFGT